MLNDCLYNFQDGTVELGFNVKNDPKHVIYVNGITEKDKI